MPLLPVVLRSVPSLEGGWFVFHFLWIGTLAWSFGALLRWLVRPTSAELRYLISLLTLGSFLGAAAMSALLAFGTGGGPRFDPIALATPGPSPRLLLALLTPVWLAGVGIAFLFLLAGIWGTRRLRPSSLSGVGNASSVPEEIRSALERWQDLLRIPHQVNIDIGERLSLPCVVGFVRPWILLPASAGTWSMRQVNHVLVHELAHVRRQDNLITLAERVIETVFWFHPAVWCVSRWLDEEREHCCDEFVLALTHDPQAYAETLISLADSVRPRLIPASPLSHHPLNVRLRRILFREESIMFRPRAREVLAAIPCGLIWCFVVFGEFVHADPSSPGITSLAQTRTEQIFVTAEPLEAKMLRRFLSDLVGREPTAEESQDYLSGRKTLGMIAQAATSLNNRTPITADLDRRITELTQIVKRNWGPEQVIGVPDTMNAGDQVTAWASLSQDGQEEWLICEFKEPTLATAVRVHETYNPGSLVKVTILDDKDTETLAWEGEDPTPRDQPKGISVIPIKPDGPVKRIKLYFDSVAVPGWNEIDAVGLDREDESTTWTVAAQASTTFAEPAGTPGGAGGIASWSPQQAAGEPNTPGAGDYVTAWASAGVDDQPEWLVCGYAADQKPKEIVVHENYNPGAVNKITAFDAEGVEHLAWEGEDPTPRDQARGISVFPVNLPFATKKIKVYIDSPAVPGWNEIDAVGLRDADGQTAWAETVDASSTYANFASPPPTTMILVPADDLQRLQMDVNGLKDSVKELQQLREEIKELKELLKQKNE